jgi:hypothetical protein
VPWPSSAHSFSRNITYCIDRLTSHKGRRLLLQRVQKESLKSGERLGRKMVIQGEARMVLRLVGLLLLVLKRAC